MAAQFSRGATPPLMNCGKEFRDIEFLSDPTMGEVRIGTTPPLAASFVFTVIEQLSRRYPGMVFRVVAEGANQAAQRQNLNERAVDLLIFRKEASIVDDQASFEFLFKSPYVVAAGGNNPWTKRRKIALAELVDELWTLPAPDDAFGSFVTEAIATGAQKISANFKGGGSDSGARIRSFQSSGFNFPVGIRSSRNWLWTCRLPGHRSASSH